MKEEIQKLIQEIKADIKESEEDKRKLSDDPGVSHYLSGWIASQEVLKDKLENLLK